VTLYGFRGLHIFSGIRLTIYHFKMSLYIVIGGPMLKVDASLIIVAYFMNGNTKL
jgi:hypothetical protein